MAGVIEVIGDSWNAPGVRALGAVVLAAGASTRMGHPKALTLVAGEVAVARILRILAALGADPAIVVTGPHHDEILPKAPAPATVVRNLDWERGRTGSLKRGLERVPPGRDVVVWPVDHPLVTADTLERLVASPGWARVPVFAGQRGHPIVLSSEAQEAVRRMPDQAPLRDALRAEPRLVVEVPVADDGILRNLDEKGDLASL